MHTLVKAALFTILAGPLAAQTNVTDMNDTERDAFRAEVRAYLMDNPEVLMEAIGVLEQREQAQQASADGEMLAQSMDALIDDGFSFQGGNPDGDITIVEFMDYRCGYCKKAYPEVAELISSDGNIRYIVKEFPILGEQSVLASQFAVATMFEEGSDVYRDVHSTLMEYRGDITEATLARLAETLGLDAEPILARMDSDEVMDVIRANRALGAKLQINGTPTFVIGDELVRGYVPFDSMVALVEEMRS